MKKEVNENETLVYTKEIHAGSLYDYDIFDGQNNLIAKVCDVNNSREYGSLIVQAFNIKQETGKSPTQLVKRIKELEIEVMHLKEAINELDDDF